MTRPILFLLFAFILPAAILAESSVVNMAARISPSGFQFLSERFGEMLTKVFLGRSMPGYIFQRPDGWLNIYYLHIYKFYVQHVEIRPILDHIHLIASDVSVGICGSWDVNRTSFLLPSTAYGNFTLSTNRVDCRVDLAPFLLPDGASQLHVKDCDVSIAEDEVEWKVDGGFSTMFFSTSDPIPLESIERQYCRGLRDAIAQLNDDLWRIHGGYVLTNGVMAQYTLINTVEEKGNFTVNGFVVTYYAGSAICNLPQHPVNANDDSLAPAKREFMMSVWLSESIFNCLLDGLHWSHHFEWIPLVDRRSAMFGEYMATSCKSEAHCMGTFVPVLGREFPFQFVAFYLTSVEPPRVHFTDLGEATLRAEVDVQMRLAVTDKELVRLHVSIRGNLEPYVANGRLNAKLTDSLPLSISVVKTSIGQSVVSPSVWQRLVDYMKPKIMVAANALIADGIFIPLPDSVELVGDYAEVVLGNGAMRIGFDLVQTRTRQMTPLTRPDT